MNDDNEKPKETTRDPSDAEIEREIRSQRKFSLAEAIGRSGGDLLRGASPVTRRRQAEFAIEELVERHLSDSEGALGPVLVRQIGQSEELLSSYDDPIRALIHETTKILGSAEALRRFVRSVDQEWGRLYNERPHFDRDNEPPAKDDPYTEDSVRTTLRSLLDSLEGANAQG
jgi:hypothetical protein